MIKTLLILPLLLLPTVNADDHITYSHCSELYDVMYESVEEGLITHDEMIDIWHRCNDIRINSYYKKT